MKRILMLCVVFISLIGCEKKIPDGQPLFTSKSVGNGKVEFTNTAANATSFEWDFGDGKPKSTEPNPSHIYEKMEITMLF